MDATTDLRPLYQDAADQLAKLIDAVTPEQLGLPTPCEEFDVRALLSHTVGGMHRAAYIGEGGHPTDVAALVGEAADDAWPAVLGRARARMAAAWADDATLERPTAVPWGTVPGRAALGGYFMELVTHSWDLAQAVAPGTVLDEELGRVALAFAEQALPAERRGPGVPFGPVRPAPADADPTTRLAAWLGRA
ncbi:TIGR03086 family metal-binding protein [Kitasatospora kazusensis]|uniref:TIGR03086 family metal-binding protein n=1 Tax=Kitasatospora kazusensis TaxID=407974 RepID=A0ABP5LV01_9ACTN